MAHPWLSYCEASSSLLSIVWLNHQRRRWRFDHHLMNMILSQLASWSSFSCAHHMWELCVYLMTRLLLDPSFYDISNTTNLPMIGFRVFILKYSILWMMMMINAYLSDGSTKMILLITSTSLSFIKPMESRSLTIMYKQEYMFHTSSFYVIYFSKIVLWRAWPGLGYMAILLWGENLFAYHLSSATLWDLICDILRLSGMVKRQSKSFRKMFVKR